MRLAEVVRDLDAMQAEVAHAVTRYCEGEPTEFEGVGYALAINGLKLSASTRVVDIVTQSLRIRGMAGYSESSPFSVARQLRDAHSAALMIANDRILASNAALALVHKGEP
jgi:acyl-CoA dehydrogenase